MRQQHDRFKSAPWYAKEDVHILVGGAGGIGSWTSLLLARAGFKPLIYDFDSIEEHNIGGQLFSKKLVGKFKVDAIAQVIKEFSDDEVIVFNEKIDAGSPTNIYAISAFDNMAARKAMYESWFKEFGNDSNAIFIDGRLNAEQMQIFCVRGGTTEQIVANQADYAGNQLFDDSAVEDAPCTMKQTSHAAAMIAAHITGFFTNHYTNVVEKEDLRTIPYFWEYFIPMDLLDVKY